MFISSIRHRTKTNSQKPWASLSCQSSPDFCGFWWILMDSVDSSSAPVLQIRSLLDLWQGPIGPADSTRNVQAKRCVWVGFPWVSIVNVNWKLVKTSEMMWKLVREWWEWLSNLWSSTQISPRSGTIVESVAVSRKCKLKARSISTYDIPWCIQNYIKSGNHYENHLQVVVICSVYSQLFVNHLHLCLHLNHWPRRDCAAQCPAAVQCHISEARFWIQQIVPANQKIPRFQQCG